MWWVSRTAWLLSGWKSTVRRGLPDFLGQTTILWHPKSDVLIEAGLHSILPVDRDGYGRVGGNWASVWVDHQAHRTTSHHGEELVVTNIEGAAGIVCKQPLFESSTVLFRGRERQR